MKTKVWKGWVPKYTKPTDVFEWDISLDQLRIGLCAVEKLKGRKLQWESWPPKKVTVTVEIED